GVTGLTLSQIHKTYIRPVLYYGLDALNMSKNDKKLIRKFETDALKVALGLSTRLKNKLLMTALKVDDFTCRMKIMRLNLYSRLLTNNYTLKFIQALISEYKTSIPNGSIINGLAHEAV
ncbi:MAG: hypothetical protein ACK559_31090, partial [bacterium]